MSRNTSNLIKFALCALATVGLLWVFGVEDWQLYHIVVLVLCVATWIWYLWHVFNDK